jgi:hypothetical protein
MTDFNNGITEGTDMGVEAFAYSPKLRSPDERWHYTKNERNNNLDDIDEGFETYVSHHDNASDKKQDINANATTYQPQYEQTNNNTYNQNDNQQPPSETKPKLDTNKFIDEEYENLSPLEKRLRRLDIMRALGELRDLGCKVTNYNIDDDYYMMKYELDLHRSIRSKRNWLGLYSHMLIGAVKGVELLNNNYNPFDFSLSGLSDEVKADKNTYYEILGEIYEHHNVPGKKMNPWFRLFVSLIGVVVVVGGKNNAHKFIPNRAQSVENDQEYIERLRAKAAKDSQSQISKQKGNGQNNQQNNNQQNNNQQNNNQQNNNQVNNNLDDYMNKQHEKAAQRAHDLEELKRQELEYQRYQQMMSGEKNKFNDIKKGLEMTASPRSMASSRTNSASQRRQQIQMHQTQPKSRSRTETITEKDTMSEMSTSTNNTVKSSQTSKSSVSQISINNNLVKKLNKKNINTKKNSSVDNITADQISFGSNKKK